MRGRFHSYEGHPMTDTVMPVKLMRSIGVEKVIVTNAAGGINSSFNVGDIAVISDHIGFPLLAGKNPMVGKNDDTYGGPRFQPMSNAYDLPMRQLILGVASRLGFSDFVRKTGVYCFVSGPQYE